MRSIIFSLFTFGTVLTAAADSVTNQSLPAVPEGHSLPGDHTRLNKTNYVFEPVHYRPIAAKVMGLKQNTLSLDGAWRIDAKPGQNVRETPLNAASWGNFHVPGQWAQQGYDIPQDKTAALAREFTIPAKWAGYRIFLRFDAIHGGTHYWLNGKPLGYSENLFTPVEWEITDAAKVGQTNRLDLEMKVATASERLSNSSDYAGLQPGRHRPRGEDLRLAQAPYFHSAPECGTG